MIRGNYYGIVTVKKTWQYTKVCLESFLKHTKLREQDKFIMIDNDGYWSEINPDATYDILVNETPKNYSQNMNTLLKLAEENGMDAVFISNDVVLTPNWADKFLDNMVSLPSCNQTHFYGIPDSTSLEEFNNRYALLNAAAYKHGITNKNSFDRLSMPTYLCKIPLEVIKTVGYFDEKFNHGGEDADYRIRCLKEGFETRYCSSYVLHFNGKSSWNGAETSKETKERNEKYQRYFMEKWGEDLYNLFMVSGNPLNVIEKHSLHNYVAQQKFNDLITQVIRINSR